MSVEHPSIVTLFEPSRIRVTFNEDEDLVVLIDLDDQGAGVVSVPAADWFAIAEVVACHLRARGYASH